MKKLKMRNEIDNENLVINEDSKEDIQSMFIHTKRVINDTKT